MLAIGRFVRGNLRISGALLLALASMPAQTPEIAEERRNGTTASVRLLFGLDRFTPQRWDGAVAVSPGRVERLGGVHFEGRDRIVGRNRWLVSNRVTRYADSTTQRGYDPVHTRQFAMIPNGVAATLDAAEGAVVEIETEQGGFSFPLRDLAFGQPLRFLAERASAERIPTTLDLTAGETDNDYAALAAAEDGSVWLSWIAYQNERDAVWLARHGSDGWSQPIRVSPPEYPDNFRTALAVDGGGSVVVAWSSKSPDGDWNLFSRTVRNGEMGPVRSVWNGGASLDHRAASDSNGKEIDETGRYFPDLVVREATRFIVENKDRPFFLHCAFNVPHYPEQSDPKFRKMYDSMPMPRRSYASMITTTDDRIGQVLRTLDQWGLRDNTIVLFMSDNGHSTEEFRNWDRDYGAHGGGGNTGPWRGAKASLFEGGIRVPCILSLPGRIPEGETRDQAISNMDFLPTILELCGIDPPDYEIDGASLAAVLRSNDAPSTHEVFHWMWQDQWAVREGDWKLIGNGRDTTGLQSRHAPRKEMGEFYLANLSDEPPESTNHAADRPELVARLKKLHDDWLASVTA